MAVSREWLFEGIPQLSKLGILLELSSRRVRSSSPDLKDLDLRVKVVEELGQMVGAEIKPFDFIALGPAYLSTEPGRRVIEPIESCYGRLHTEARERRRVKIEG